MIRSTLAIITVFAWLASGCSSTFDPWPIERVDFLDRAQTQERGDIRVTAAVPSSKETLRLFSHNLYRRGVQPVWLELENGREEPITFLPVGTDVSYFSPIQAANVDLRKGARATVSERDRYFFDASLNIRIEPGETRSGFLFTNVDEGTKSFNVDLSSDSESISFTFFVPVPGLEVDHYAVDWEGIHGAHEVVDVDASTLAAALAELPACATDKKGTGTADPLNIVVVGEPNEIYYAFIRAGWDETETITRSSLVKTAGSFLTGGEYRYSPVSSLFLFGRKQDVALQKARESINRRNHLRLWMSPLRFEGKPVFIGQISRDIGVRFTWKTITTHKIDPNVDETREYLLENLAYSQSLAKFGYTEGVGSAPPGAPRGNLTGDPYFTDGLRVVLWVSSVPMSISEIEYVALTPPARVFAGQGSDDGR